MLNDSKSTYTRQEVANLLNIKEKTVYSYVSEGKIEQAPNPYQVRKEALYTKASVDNLLQSLELETKVDGYTLQEAAGALGITRQRINALINEHDIKVIKNSKVRGGVPKTIIPNDSFELLNDITKTLRKKTNKQSKMNFYSPEYDIALYQLHLNPEGETYRVKKNNGVWGFMSNSNDTFVPYDYAVNNLSLNTCYSIHKKPVNSQSGYAEIQLPMITGFVYLDYLFEAFGVENMYIDVEKSNQEQLSVFVRQNIIPLEEIPQHKALNELKDYIVDGEWIVTEDELFIVSGQKRISAVISLENYNKLNSTATTVNKSMSEVLEDILSTHFKNMN